MHRFLPAALALLALACAHTGAPASGGGGASDTTGSETAGSETAAGADTPASETAASETAGSTGGLKTIAEIQQHESSKVCPDAAKIVNTPNTKGAQVKSAIVVSPVSTGGTSLDSMYVQAEGGGAWNGLLVVASKGKLADVKQGDVVSLIGEIKEYYCLTEIDVKDLAPNVEKQGTGLATAVTVDVDAIGDKGKPDDRESYESVLVSLQGVVVSEPLADKGKDGKFHSMFVGKTDADQTLMISSGYGIYPQDKDNKPNYKKGQKLDIKGFLDYSFGAFKIKPVSITVQ